MTIKAIETKYKGYRFRSRLEARWAVAFDLMGVIWEYEPEGFELSDGTRYLPDFRLQHIDRPWAYFEVKPEGEDLTKPIMFAKESGEYVTLLANIPFLKDICGIAWSRASFMEGVPNFSVILSSGNIWVSGSYYWLIDQNFPVKEDRPPFTNAKVFDIARSCRFEHGERAEDLVERKIAEQRAFWTSVYQKTDNSRSHTRGEA